MSVEGVFVDFGGAYRYWVVNPAASSDDLPPECYIHGIANYNPLDAYTARKES